MSHRHALWVTVIALLVASDLFASEMSLEDGLYEVHFRLELPHLEAYAAHRKTKICIDQNRTQQRDPPLPLLSQNDIFSGCRVENVRLNKAAFRYDITCEGRGAARASAVYVLASEAFAGRVSIMQGAKNMTMTEVQRGRRIGHCD